MTYQAWYLNGPIFVVYICAGTGVLVAAIGRVERWWRNGR